MVIEISVAGIAAVFIILALSMIITMVKTQKTLKEVNKVLSSAKKELDELGAESLKLVKNLNEFTTDIRSKLQIFDILFSVLPRFRGEAGKGKKARKFNWATDIVEGLSAGYTLYDKIKRGIDTYVKRR